MARTLVSRQTRASLSRLVARLRTCADDLEKVIGGMSKDRIDELQIRKWGGMKDGMARIELFAAAGSVALNAALDNAVPTFDSDEVARQALTKKPPNKRSRGPQK